jgi:hypothetical protein
MVDLALVFVRRNESKPIFALKKQRIQKSHIYAIVPIRQFGNLAMG